MTDEDDKDLFRREMTDVRRLDSDRVPASGPRPEPVARFKRKDERAALEETLTGRIDPAVLETGEELVYRRPSLQPTDLRRLRRGHFRVEDEIDLHGLNASEARQALADFLQEAAERRLRCIRVIHGKGLRSGPTGPVIKRRVGRWLRRREEVLAFATARPVDGGTGAVYVLLKS